MKDFNDFQPNKERLSTIVSLFATGAEAAQAAFRESIQYVIDELEAHRDGSQPAPRGCLQAIKDAYTKAGLNERGTLSKAYFTPTFAIASAVHSGKASPMILHLWENFEDTGDDLEGSVVTGPLYTPGRVNGCWGKLNAKDETPFAVDMEGIFANDGQKGERRWHELTIAELKELNRGKETTPEATGLIMSLLGDPSNLDKRGGTLAKAVKDLRKKNEKVKSDTVSDLCDTVDAFIVEARADVAVTLADAEVEAAEQRKLAAEQKRLERAQGKGDAAITDQKVRGGEVTSDDDQSEVDERIDATEAVES